MSLRPIRTVLVDDEPLALDGLRSLLANEEDIDVVAEFRSGTDFLRDAEAVGADVVFLDVEMPSLSGLDVLEQLHAASAQPHVVFVTGFDQYAVRAFEEQALDYVLKPYHADRTDLEDLGNGQVLVSLTGRYAAGSTVRVGNTFLQPGAGHDDRLQPRPVRRNDR